MKWHSGLDSLLDFWPALGSSGLLDFAFHALQALTYQIHTPKYQIHVLKFQTHNPIYQIHPSNMLRNDSVCQKG